MKIRLIGKPEEVLLGICRLRQAFSKVDHGEPVACRQKPGHVIMYVTVVF